MTRGQATVIDLFSGAGGLSLGFHAAGARVRAAVDWSEAAGRTFRANFAQLQADCPPDGFFGEEGHLERLDLERVAHAGTGPDILVGGPPCQGFSRLGRAKLASLADPEATGDPRNELYRRFVEAARLWRPLGVVMENVPGMLTVRGENVADVVASEIANCGYRVGYALLNSVWFGVPQFRERLFFIGIREDLGLIPSMPEATHITELPVGYVRPSEAVTLSLAFVPRFELEVRMKEARRAATSTRDALDDLPRIIGHLEGVKRPRSPDELQVMHRYTAEPVSPFARLMRRWPSLPELAGVTGQKIRHTPRDFETFRRMRPGDRYPEAMELAQARFREVLVQRTEAGEFLEEGSLGYLTLWKAIVPPYPVDKFRDKWGKLDPDRPSWTVPAHLSHDTYSHIHYDDTQARTISVREAARLQSFPDAFEFSGNMNDCYTQIGNAVPPVLAWAIAANLLRQLGFRNEPCPLGLSCGTPNDVP